MKRIGTCALLLIDSALLCPLSHFSETMRNAWLFGPYAAWKELKNRG